MTRISLKEQYDNSSVVKQIADLTDQIDGYDEQIEQATETANAAKTAATEAKTTADAAAAKNTEQDGRLDSIESVNTVQEQEIAGIKLKDAQQDASIAELAEVNNQQDATIETLAAKNAEQDTKIATIQAKDAEQDLSISTILDTDTKQDVAIDALKTITNTLTNEVISAVNVVDGTQNGSIMVRLTDTGGSIISSPSYPWGQVATFALKQGGEAGYVRGVLTLSDGEVIESNDFQILQIQESDVYVTSITLTPYPTTGKLGGEIGYSNGNVAQINIIDVPTAPGVTTNINDLLSRMGVVESGVNDLDVRVKAIEDTPGVGAFTNTSRGTILGSAEDGKVSANDDGTGSVSGWSDVVKSAQISDMLTKTDAASTYLTKTDAAAAYETLEGAEQINVVANEAKSTAEDAQTKANGCFNSVAVNAAGDGLTFGTPSGATSEITLPSTGFKLVDLTEPIALSQGVNTGTLAYSSTQYLYTPTEKIITCIGSPNVLMFSQAADQLFFQNSSGKTLYYIMGSTFSNTQATELYNEVFSQIPSIQSGTVAIYFVPAFTRSETETALKSAGLAKRTPINDINPILFYETGSWGLNNCAKITYTISDNEIISIARDSTRAYFGDAFSVTSVSRFVIMGFDFRIS